LVIVLFFILSFFFWILYCLSFCPFSFGHCIVCPFSLGYCIVCPFSFGSSEKPFICFAPRRGPEFQLSGYF
jgi:hypothetical protein